jgi:type IV secretion system protein TrbB
VTAQPQPDPQPRDIAAARRAAMLKRLLGDLIGGLVAQEGLTDIEANSDGRIWASFLGKPKACVGSMAPHDAEKLIYAVAKAAGETVGPEHLSLAAELEAEGEAGPVVLRFQGFLRPVLRAPGFVIRKPPSRIFTLDEFVVQGVLADWQRERLFRAVADHENVLIAGGTGAGKTTLMNALLAAVAVVTPRDRVICIERTRELQCPVENAEYIRIAPGYPAQKALEDTLRANPDRIMVGEVRGAEAADMLMAWNTGHDGGFCTVHAKTSAPTPKAALLRLEQAASLSNPSADYRPQIGETVDLIVCIQKSANVAAGRVVSHIAAVNGWDGASYEIRSEGGS